MKLVKKKLDETGSKLDFSSVYTRVFFFLLFFFVTIFFNSNLSPHPPLFHRLVLPTSWLCPSGFHFHRRVVLVTPDTPPLPPVTVRSQQGQTACWVSRWFHSSFPRASDDGCPSPQVRSLCLSTIPDRHSSSSHRLCLRPGEDGLLLGSVHAGPPLLPAAGERLLFFSLFFFFWLTWWCDVNKCPHTTHDGLC